MDSDTRTATQLVARIDDLEPGLRADEFVRTTESLLFAVRFTGQLALMTASELPPFRIDKSQFFQHELYLLQVRYGSPLQIVIDLMPIVEFMSSSAYRVFGELISETAALGGFTWRNLDHALNLWSRYEHAKYPSEWEEKHSDAELAQMALLANEALNTYLDPAIDLIVESRLRDLSSPREQAALGADTDLRSEVREGAEYLLEQMDRRELANQVTRLASLDVTLRLE